jgi:hypothetical protein
VFSFHVIMMEAPPAAAATPVGGDGTVASSPVVKSSHPLDGSVGDRKPNEFTVATDTPYVVLATRLLIRRLTTLVRVACRVVYTPVLVSLIASNTSYELLSVFGGVQDTSA